MKTMTCKQMGGPCETAIQGATSDEMMNNGAAHIQEMAIKGDEEHKKVLSMMEEMKKNPESGKQWNDKFQKDFEDLPED